MKYSYWGCAKNANVSFGLQKSMCFCLCDNTKKRHISERAKCNTSFVTSKTNGECGGIGCFSMYKSMNVSLSDAHFGGFCLTFRQKNDLSNYRML